MIQDPYFIPVRTTPYIASDTRKYAFTKWTAVSIGVSIRDQSRFVRRPSTLLQKTGYNGLDDEYPTTLTDTNFRNSRYVNMLYHYNKFMLSQFYIYELVYDENTAHGPQNLKTRLDEIYKTDLPSPNQITNFTKKKKYVNNIEINTINSQGKKYFYVRNKNSSEDRIFLNFNFHFDYDNINNIFKNDIWSQLPLYGLKFFPDLYRAGENNENDIYVGITLDSIGSSNAKFSIDSFKLLIQSDPSSSTSRVWNGLGYKSDQGPTIEDRLFTNPNPAFTPSMYTILYENKYYRIEKLYEYSNQLDVIDRNTNKLPFKSYKNTNNYGIRKQN